MLAPPSQDASVIRHSCDAAGEDDVTTMHETAAFEAERPRLVRIAGRILHDDAEAEDIVQQAWLRLQVTDQEIANLPGC